jgi:PKD repeat protein
VRYSTVILFSCLALAAACGGSKSSPTTPTSPTPPPPPPQNRAPVINSMDVAPTFGVSELTSFNFSASASDADGDAVAYAWDLAGASRTGSSGSITFTGSGTGDVKLTVTDGKGGSVSDSRTVTIGSMTGRWLGSIPGYTNLLFELRQQGPVVTGTFFEPFFGNGQVDPAQPGRIEADGSLEMRVKLSIFTDFTFRGRMDASGRRITGGVFGSGFNGQAFTMDKQ